MKTLKDLNIDRNWTLFLDRDGVINCNGVGSYIKKWDEFCFLSGVLESLLVVSEIFGRIVVVTNQQGIGKGLYSIQDLDFIHQNMLQAISITGGRIDKIYFAPQLACETSNMRKPGVGMAWAAKADFPEIDFSRSVMVGDLMTDMQFGKNSGMLTVWLSSTRRLKEHEYLIDYQFDSLSSFTRQLR